MCAIVCWRKATSSEPEHQIMVYYVGDRASWSILGVDLHGPFTCRVTKPPQSCCLLQRRPHFPYYNCVGTRHLPPPRNGTACIIIDAELYSYGGQGSSGRQRHRGKTIGVGEPYTYTQQHTRSYATAHTQHTRPYGTFAFTSYHPFPYPSPRSPGIGTPSRYRFCVAEHSRS